MIARDDVAIVGIGCRFPGNVSGPRRYWDFMLGRGDGIIEVPADRWNLDLFYDADPDTPGRSYTRHGGFIEQSPWEFDAEFFGISPREAEVMDPQQRWVLEVAWEALDDAGLAGSVGGSNAGVYVGGFMTDTQIRRHQPSARRAINNHTATSASLAMVSNRLSHALDLHGPSMTIDTACSSSLVAVHQATQALARGECDIALAGGASVMIHPELFVTMCKGKFLSRDGRCKSFDALADGYGRGEGAGIVVLKPLADALRDADRIYAVIAASGANQDGHTQGITVPNGIAQRDLARAVCHRAGLAAHDIDYVEAHGTGTPVGDPIEVGALGEAYGAVAGRTEPLLIGSVKAAIGHLEAAAGVAGLIKAALVVHHRSVPPQARLGTPNPAIPFDDLNVGIVTQPTPLGRGGKPVAVAVNGFGYGGTNAHVILDEAPAAAGVAVGDVVRLFPVSAASEAGVSALAEALGDTVSGATAVGEVCAAAWNRRAHHPFRAVLPYTDTADLAGRLRNLATDQTAVKRTVVRSGTKPVFVFSGMGPQWWAMGRELLGAGGPFARVAAEIDSVFVDIAGWSIVDELSKPEAESRIHWTEYAQPANFLLQVGLVAELAALGVEPAAVVGHSVGEVSASYISGALGLRDALTVSCHRGRLQATTDGTGALVAVEMSEASALQRISTIGNADLCLAAVNGPESVTFAGPVEAIDALVSELAAERVDARKLKVMVPYHSTLMDPILADLASVLSGIRPEQPRVALFSTVTAARVDGPEFGAKYWCANVREPVRFRAAIETMIDEGHRVFVEVGPHPVISGNIRAILAGRAEAGVAVPTLRRGERDRAQLTRAIADLYQAGCLGSACPGYSGPTPHVELPSYPWQHKLLRSEPGQAERERFGDAGRRPLLGNRSEFDPTTWATELSATELPWLPDHVVNGLVLLPGAAYLDAFLSAAAETTNHASLSVDGVRFSAPLIVDKHAVPKTAVVVDSSSMRVSFTSYDDTGERTVHSTARIVDAPADAPAVEVPAVNGEPLDADTFYAMLESRGLQYGPAFRRVHQVMVGDDVMVASIEPAVGPGTGHLAHPAIVDAALQCVAAFDDLSTGTMVPVEVDTVRRYGPEPHGTITATVRRRKGPEMSADITLTGSDGRAYLQLGNVRFAQLTPAVPATTQLAQLFYELDWRLLEVVPQVHSDRHILAVGVGQPDGEPLRSFQVADSPRRWGRRRTASGTAPLRPGALAEAIRGIGAEQVTIVVVAGHGDQANLITELAEVARQINIAVGADSEGSIDAVLVTSGAFRLAGDRHEPNVLHAALLGARRALQNEQISVRWRQVDLDPGDAGGWDPAILHEIYDGEQRVDEIALRHGLLFAPYLRRSLADRVAPYTVAAPHTDPDRSFVLDPPGSRLLEDISLRSAPRVAPGPGQIEVRLDAMGLNYKDSMKLLGVLTAHNLRGTYWGTAVGMEGVGIVERTGGGTRFSPGDCVMVSVPDMFRRYLTFDPEDGVVELIPPATAPDAAASYVPYLAAHYGLLYAAALTEEDTILVHGAAGGTGLAAVNVALHAGARVIASAGTEERRAFARAAGAHHTVNSRTTNFVDEVLRLTDGRGADVIYTSLPGEALRQNLRAAAELGRIVDIGKADIFGNGTLDLAQFDRSLQYFAVDMDRMFTFRRALANRMATEAIARLNDGSYPVLPAAIFDAGELPEAMSIVSRGTARGRVVVRMDGNPPVRPAMPEFRVRPDVTYLVTGGFGAAGLTLADWLVSEGARHLVIVSRSGPRTATAQRRVRAWREAGVELRDEPADVGDPAAMTGLIARTVQQMPRLSGVFHAAGLTEDSALDNITAESVRRVISPKLGGAWNLHHATDAAGVELDAFVLFSSITSVIGGALQLTYAAANAGLDALAQLRRAQGKAALSVNWGALSGGGMADTSAELRRYMETIGHRGILLGQVPGLLAAVMGLAADGSAMANIVVADVDWRAWLSAHPASKSSTRFAEFASTLDVGEQAMTFRAELLALPSEQRLDVLTLVLAEHVAVVLGMSPDSVEPHIPLPELGLDSLTSVELASRLAATLDIRIPAIDFGRRGGLSAIARQALVDAEAS